MKKESTVCPACEVGVLEERVGSDEYLHKGKTFTIEGTHYSKCSACGAEVVMSWQAKANDQLIKDFQRQVDGLLKGAEIKQIRKKFCLTQADAALLFGGGANAFSKYERGDVIQSVAMDRLLRLVKALPYAFETLLRIAYLPPKLVLKSKKFEGQAEFDYGECDTSFRTLMMPTNVVCIDFKVKKRLEVVQHNFDSYDQKAAC